MIDAIIPTGQPAHYMLLFSMDPVAKFLLGIPWTIGTEEEIRTPKKRRFKRSMSAIASPRYKWSPVTDSRRLFLFTKQACHYQHLQGIV